jgi:2-methylcitrate dehydratase PrpD
MHFSVALALTEGGGGLDLYTDDTVNDPRIRALSRRIVVRTDPDMKYIEAMPSEITVSTRDGRRLTLRVDAPKGRPSNPMGWSDLAAKFRGLVGAGLAEPDVAALIGSLDGLEGARMRDIAALAARARDTASPER